MDVTTHPGSQGPLNPYSVIVRYATLFSSYRRWNLMKKRGGKRRAVDLPSSLPTVCTWTLINKSDLQLWKSRGKESNRLQAIFTSNTFRKA